MVLRQDFTFMWLFILGLKFVDFEVQFVEIRNSSRIENITNYTYKIKIK